MKEFFLIPLREMKHRKIRSFLTLIGIIIGIAAIVSLITLGQGLQNAIAGQFAALGNDKIFITAKGSALTPGLSIDAVKITEDDLETVKHTAGVRRAAGMIYSTGRIEFNDHVRYFFVSGLPEDPDDRALIGEANSYTIGTGRPIEKGDKFKVVLGHQYRTKGLFDAELSLGDKILIQDQEFKVVGFMDKIGSPPDDQSILMPIDAYQEIFGSGKELGLLVAQIDSGETLEKVSDNLKKDLRKSRDVDEDKEDFNVETPAQLAGAFTVILDIVQIVLIGIASISLLVGGIGIMNTMFTTVLQRTREIGLMKAIGAKNSHILTFFVIESGFYGIVGGVIGATIGIGVAKLVELVFKLAVGPAFLKIEISFTFVALIILFSFIIGLISGISPAYRASKLNPVDSLRYE